MISAILWKKLIHANLRLGSSVDLSHPKCARIVAPTTMEKAIRFDELDGMRVRVMLMAAMGRRGRGCDNGKYGKSGGKWRGGL